MVQDRKGIRNGSLDSFCRELESLRYLVPSYGPETLNPERPPTANVAVRATNEGMGRGLAPLRVSTALAPGTGTLASHLPSAFVKGTSLGLPKIRS